MSTPKDLTPRSTPTAEQIDISMQDLEKASMADDEAKQDTSGDYTQYFIVGAIAAAIYFLKRR